MKLITCRHEKSNGKIEIPFNGSENCEFCLRKQVKEADQVFNIDNENSTPRRNIQKVPRLLNKSHEVSDPFVTPKNNSKRLTAKTPITPGSGLSIDAESPLSQSFSTPKRKPSSISVTPNDESPRPAVITDEIMTLVRTRCVDKHTIVQMAEKLGVPSNSLTKQINRSKTIFSNIFNESSVCYFCTEAPLPNISDKVMKRKMDPIIESIKQLSSIDKSSDIKTLCLIGKRICNQTGKRQLAQIFQKLSEEPENYMETFKFDVPVKMAIQVKVKVKLSVSEYDTLRDCLSDYLKMPCYDTLAVAMTCMQPTKENPLVFIMDDKPVGNYWPPLKVAQNTIEDILQVYHGENPGRVPNQLFLRGGFGGNLVVANLLAFRIFIRHVSNFNLWHQLFTNNILYLFTKRQIFEICS